MSEADRDESEKAAKKRLAAFCLGIAQDKNQPGDIRIEAMALSECCRMTYYSWEGVMQFVEDLLGKRFPRGMGTPAAPRVGGEEP